MLWNTEWIWQEHQAGQRERDQDVSAEILTIGSFNCSWWWGI